MRPAIALSREGLARVRVRPRRGCTRSASEVARSRLRGLPHTNLRGLPHATQSHPRFFTTASLSGSEIAHTRWATATAAAAAAVLLLLLLLLPLLLCCYCPAAASRPAMHRGAQTVTTDCCFSFCVFRNAHRSEYGTAAAAAAAAVAVAASAAAAAQQQ